jgi:hypothetical protein
VVVVGASMDIVRLLVRVGILALFSLAAIGVMTVLFGAQIRFDRQAEIEIRGLDAPDAAPARIMAVAGSSSAHAGEEHTVSAMPSARASRARPHPEADAGADDDSQFASVRINRPGAEPSIHRVPKER